MEPDLSSTNFTNFQEKDHSIAMIYSIRNTAAQLAGAAMIRF